jgi:hypothetical protein
MRLIGKSLLVLGILLIGVTLLNFAQETKQLASPRSIIYDTHFVQAMHNISGLVPADAILVVSTNAPYVTFFTGHTAKVPFGLSSKETLVSYMVGRGYYYLVVFQGKSDEPLLKRLFSSGGQKDLESAFARLAEYHTDFSVIIVYQLKPP